MSIEIITIGREILDGRVVDTNSAFFGQELSKIGQVPRHFQRVDDIEGDIIAAFKLAASRSKYVLVSGGLGPTSDDITAAVFAKFLGKPLIENAEAKELVRQAFERIKRPIISEQWKQALMAEGAKALPNPNGTAPGFWYEQNSIKWFFVPGVPREMKPMFLNHVLPKIPADDKFQNKMWLTQFTSEGELQQRLGAVIKALPSEISFFYRTRFPENHLGISGSLRTEELKTQFASAAKKIEALLGDDIYSAREDVSLEKVVIDSAIANKQQLMSVESCTGGLVASRLTDVAGSSGAVWGNFVSYDNRAKEWLAEQAGLGGEISAALKAHGAVSSEVATLMAKSGALVFLKNHPQKSVLCVSTTGIAGPSGGSADKPVGTCFVSVSNGTQEMLAQRVQARAGLERDQLKLFFSQKALDALRLTMKNLG